MSQIAQIKLYSQTIQKWYENFSDYQSTEYALKIFLKKKDSTKTELTGAAQSDGSFLFQTTTAINIPESGNHNYQIIALKDSNDYPVEDGILYVSPNLSEDNDGRSQWHIIHDYLLDSYLEMAKAGRLATQVSINGRTTTYDRAQLLKEINNAARRAGLSLDGLGKAKKVNKILARF